MNKSIGSIIDEMYATREERRELAKEDKILKATYDELDASLVSALEATGQTSGASDIATASIKKTIVADVQDWDRFHAWLKRTNRLYMLERRPAQAAFREFVETSPQHKPPPGVQKFEIVNISLRNK